MRGRREHLIFSTIIGILAAGLVGIPSIGAEEALTSGPFVDNVTFNVIEGGDQQVLALQNNEIDLIGDMIDPVHLPTLDAAENIEVANVQRNGYGYVTINTAKYPMNITAFRRAVAFALDKYAISAEVWDGLSLPQDSCVPQVNPWSSEGLLDYTYYQSNVELGKELLEAAGFEDTDEDGWYDTGPNGPWENRGPNGEILVECAQSSNIAIQVGAYVAEALNNLGIPAVSEATDFYEYLTRLYFHDDYDIVFLGSSFTDFNVDWLAYDYWSEYADEDYWNFPNFRNDTYDSWREQLLYSTEYDDVYEAAFEMQKIWVYQSPMVICYANILLSAYRTDRFEGYVNDVSGGVPGWWTNYKVHLKDSEGGPFGGSFRWSLPLDVDTFNHMATSSPYSMKVLNELYDSLLIRTPTGEDMPWLAESYTVETHDDNDAIPENHTRFVFNMVQNATWTDGRPLTAFDAAFSLNFYRDAPGNPYGVDLVDVTAAFAQTNYTLVVEFNTESYWHLTNIVYKPIIPKHVFELIPLDEWAQWNPNPPTEAMVTSGPFNVSAYVPGEFVELARNPSYFRSPQYSASGPTFLLPPQDLTYQVGTIGHTIFWWPSDDNPEEYVLYRDDAVVRISDWNGSIIMYFVDGLDVGVYEYRLVVKDCDGLTAEQTITVTVVNDTISPLIVCPGNITYIEGEVGNAISWNATDEYPQVYVILRNGTMLAFGIWDGDPIQIDVDGLSLGVYNYTLLVTDVGLNTASDSVFVFVVDGISTTSTTETTDETPTSSGTSSTPSDIFTGGTLSLLVTVSSILIMLFFGILIIRSRPR